jgi:apolipoprotein N-acyltransferase
LRAEIPLFPLGWNLLAYSQAAYVPIIQFANIFGSWGLGFLIALVNAAVFFMWEKRKEPHAVLGLLLMAAVVLAGLLTYGNILLSKPVKPSTHLKLSVLQGNIPQSIKWMHQYRRRILDIHEELTRLAAEEKPDLIIWPESSFPGYFNTDRHSELVCALAKEVDIPLLVGGLYWVTEQEAYNSAYLIGNDGSIIQHYDKIKLVPFAEYTPLKFFLGGFKPLLRAVSVHDFTVGQKKVIFQWSRREYPFAVLICFEDAFHDLARDFVDRGAKFLVVITNDAWFGKTGEPYQHLQASIFRAVENGVPVVRAANTGVSGFISSRGELLASVKDAMGEETFIAGQKTYDLPIVNEKTFYRRWGYIFPYSMMLIFFGLGLFLLRKGDVV